MPYERRRFGRSSVNWRGQVRLEEGHSLDVRVVDVSGCGARLLMPVSPPLRRQDLLDLTAWQRDFWPMPAKRIDIRGRVVRVVRHGDCPLAEVGIRFFSPIRRPARLLDLSWLRQWAVGAQPAPCA